MAARLNMPRIMQAAAAVAVLCALASPARADLQLCNRMSYVVEAAIGIEDKGTAATRGWFRLDPGQCRIVLQGEVQAEALYLHARALAVYGESPLPRGGHADLCVGQENNFVLAAARNCSRSDQKLVRFTQVQPTETDKGHTAYLAEEAEYSEEQARDAGIQRLLVIAGYDASPIDGVRGSKTDAALMNFLQENNLAATAAGRSDFFDTLIAVAQKPDATGFAWCNDTTHPVMASLGVEDGSGITTRGWYRVEPGKCLRPDLKGRPRKLYSFAEAVGGDGQPLRRGARALAWGGETILCTRNVKFDLSDHKDCTGQGLTSTGFAPVEFAGRGGTTIRFKMP
jgi:uncharacterized membrane protein